MKDSHSGELVSISVEEQLGPYLVVPADQAQRIHETFDRHRVPHRLYPTASNALTIVYLVGNTALEYAQALLDALP